MRLILALIINIAIVLLTVNAFLIFRHNQEEMHPGKTKFHFFIYFTSDSNILNGICSLILILFLLMMLCGNGISIPFWVYALHFIGTCAVMVTCATVILFLGPIAGYKKMYTGSDLYLHLICPVLSLVSIVILSTGYIGEIPFYMTFLGIIPTVIYGILYIILVLLVGPEKGGWEDFYTFNRGGKWYISASLMIVGSYLISLGLFFLSRV